MQDRTVILFSIAAAILITLAFHVAVTHAAAPDLPAIDKPPIPIPGAGRVVVEARTVTHHDANGYCDLRYSTRDSSARITVYQAQNDKRLVLARGIGLVKASAWSLAQIGIDVELAGGKLPCRNQRIVGRAGSMLVVVFYDYHMEDNRP